MAVMYDVVCSLVIGGILLVMIFSFNGNISASALGQTIRMTTQTNMTALGNIVEFEFRKIGYRIDAPPADSGVLQAGRHTITVRGDFDNDGAVDQLRYYFDSSSVSGLPNTNTHLLRRVFNGNDRVLSSCVTSCRFYYFDRNGMPLNDDPVPLPSEIFAIRLALNVESTVPFKEPNGEFVKTNPGVYWDRTFAPQNLR